MSRQLPQSTGYRGHFLGTPTLVVLFAVFTLAGCASTSDTEDESWSRSFAASFDEVWDAAIQVLREADFEIFRRDRERGRLAAELQDTVLELRISQRGEVVIVDIMAGGSSMVPGAQNRHDTAVTTILHEINRVLRADG